MEKKKILVNSQSRTRYYKYSKSSSNVTKELVKLFRNYLWKNVHATNYVDKCSQKLIDNKS